MIVGEFLKLFFDRFTTLFENKHFAPGTSKWTECVTSFVAFIATVAKLPTAGLESRPLPNASASLKKLLWAETLQWMQQSTPLSTLWPTLSLTPLAMAGLPETGQSRLSLPTCVPRGFLNQRSCQVGPSTMWPLGTTNTTSREAGIRGPRSASSKPNLNWKWFWSSFGTIRSINISKRILSLFTWKGFLVDIHPRIIRPMPVKKIIYSYLHYLR